jgi:hypothetical protein
MSWLRGYSREFDEDYISKVSQKLGLSAHVGGGFLRAVQRNLLKDLASYSILKNQKYKEKFAIHFNTSIDSIPDIYNGVMNIRYESEDGSFKSNIQKKFDLIIGANTAKKLMR